MNIKPVDPHRKIPFTTLFFLLAVMLLAGVIAYLQYNKKETPTNDAHFENSSNVRNMQSNEAGGDMYNGDNNSNVKDTTNDD